MLRHRHQANEFATSRLDRMTESKPVISRNAISCDQPAGQSNDFEFIPTVYMESQHSTDGPTSRDFSSIYIVKQLWGPQVESHWSIFQKNGLFRRKRPLTRKFSKICSERIHRYTDPHIVSKFCKIWTTGSRWNRALLTRQKKFPLALASAPIASKICQG